MEKQKFDAILPYIGADLVDTIAKSDGISEAEAISRLYTSELYARLEDEESKLWQYSTPMLYQLYHQVEQDGHFQFPDV